MSDKYSLSPKQKPFSKEEVQMGKTTVIIEADGHDDLRNRVAALHKDLSHESITAAKVTAKEESKSPATKEKEGKKAEKAAAAADTDLDTTTEVVQEDETDLLGDGEAAVEAKKYEVKDLQGALKKVMDSKGKGHGIPAAKDILKKFKVARASEVKESEHAAFVAACEALVK